MITEIMMQCTREETPPAAEAVPSATLSLRNVDVVLHQPRGAGNIGSVARVVRNTALGGLVVTRKRPLRQTRIRTMAVHAGDVVDSMRHFETLAEAVAGYALVVGTTAHAGPYRRGARPPRVAALEIVARAQRQPVALVFGPEDRGLSNAELKLCHQLITIPAAPEYLSLNLAQAVMVCAYELFVAAQTSHASPELPDLAVAGEVERVYTHLREALLSIGFLHPDNPDHIMSALRRLFGRAGLETREARILLGLARQISWFANRGRQTMADEQNRASQES